MSDSDDTDVLLLIPNDFFSVDDTEAPEFGEKCAATTTNLMSFSSNKIDPQAGKTHADPPLEPPCASTAFERYCANHMESSLQHANPNNILLDEIDLYLSQVQQAAPPRTMYCESSAGSEIPSLKDLWQSEGANKTILEERLRRRHLEKNLEATQVELIEAQQKVSVALSVDQAKDVAIGKLRTTIKIVQQQAATTEEELRRRCRDLEVDLRNSLEQSKRAKELNEVLEGKVAHLSTATNDIREINKKLMEDLQVGDCIVCFLYAWLTLI